MGDVWSYPLSVPDMEMAWRALREGRLPSGEFIEALEKTVEDGGLSVYGLNPQLYRGDCSRRRAMASRLALAIWEFKSNGTKPTGAFSGARRFRRRRRK